jgi:MraZ protein
VGTRGADELIDDTFSGTYSPRLDEKGRLILPAKFRPQMEEGLMVTKGLDRCLYLYPRRGFEQEAAELKALEKAAATREEKQEALMRLRKFTGNGLAETPDKQGRITVPAALRTYAGLDRDVVVVGVYDRVELWDRAAHEEYERRTDDPYSEGGA